MANHTDEALRALTQSYKDILVQAGKHFKVYAKDGPGALDGTSSTIGSKVSAAMSQYQVAVSHLEGEIKIAQDILLRDLERLRAARAPRPVTAPVQVPVPTPVPTPVAVHTVAPSAPMMELPSAAAHSHTLNAAPYPPGMDTKPMAPFPDMGMGFSTDMGDVAGGGKKPSPRVQPGSVKPVPRTAPPAGPKPSPKPATKPTPPAKVTPVPLPQIPRQAFQASSASGQPKAQTQTAIPPPKPPQAILPPQQTAVTRMAPGNAGGAVSMPPSGPGSGAGANAGGDGPLNGGGHNELTFTDMEFSLVAPPGEPQPQGAPPAPMSDFDLSAFVADNGNNKQAAPPNTNAASNPGGGNTAEIQHPGQGQNMGTNMGTNMDDLFNLGDANGGGDNIFDLGGNAANDSTFDDMIFFGNTDADMEQFDDAYFGL